MKIRNAICVAWLLASGTVPSLAQGTAEKITVSALLAQDYTIAGTVATPGGGGGLFLRKGAKLYFCFVSETPQSATVVTEYCKPVE